MTKIEVLDRLFQARTQLQKRILATPTTMDEAAVLQQLSDARERLSSTIADLVDADLHASVSTLDASAKTLDGLNDQLTQLPLDVAGAKSAITIAGQIISVAASVIAAVV